MNNDAGFNAAFLSTLFPFVHFKIQICSTTYRLSAFDKHHRKMSLGRNGTVSVAGLPCLAVSYVHDLFTVSVAFIHFTNSAY